MMTLWILLIGLPFILGLVKSAFSRWKNVPASSGVTGADAARQILRAANIYDVEVLEINDMLGDHFDPTKKVLCLSSDVYHTPSVAALGIAAHEVGHAIQHAKAYGPLQLRMAVIPATMLVSQVLPFVLLAGFIVPLLFFKLVGLVAICFAVLAVFQLITLPVEFDASRRAKVILGQMGLIQSGTEAAGVNNVLDSAALTYVAALVAVLGQLAYYVMLAQGNRR